MLQIVHQEHVQARSYNCERFGLLNIIIDFSLHVVYMARAVADPEEVHGVPRNPSFTEGSVQVKRS